MSIADELITRGWNQNGYENDQDGSVCIMKAAQYAHGRGGGGFVCPRRVLAVLAVTIGTRDIAPWNDHPDRTFDEVLRVAKEADEILASDG